MRILERTFLTEDEDYNPAGKLAEQIEAVLVRLELDAYAKQYVVRVTVDEVDNLSTRTRTSRT